MSAQPDRHYIDDDEAYLAVQGLELLLADKIIAWNKVVAQGFTEIDFGIPQIKALIERLEGEE